MTDLLGDPAANASVRWSELALARRALFEARDGITAEFLRRADVSAMEDLGSAPPSPGAPPFVFALPKPSRPRSWRKRRAFVAAQRKRRRILQDAGLFDADWYQARYPDVGAAGMEAIDHFLDHGSFEGRSPGPHFDAIAYLARNPDIVAEQLEPWLHYVMHGKAEGRSPH